jgi:hypothetical protein
MRFVIYYINQEYGIRPLPQNDAAPWHLVPDPMKEDMQAGQVLLHCVPYSIQVTAMTHELGRIHPLPGWRWCSCVRSHPEIKGFYCCRVSDKEVCGHFAAALLATSLQVIVTFLKQ